MTIHHFTSFGTEHRFAEKQHDALRSLLFALGFLFAFSSVAQTTVPCNDPPYQFEGPEEPTLCEIYSIAYFSFQIGEGTPYPTSSQLPSPLPSQNIAVVGDFIVNTSITFEDVNMKFSPNTGIFVQNNNLTLRFRNCKFYCNFPIISECIAALWYPH